MRIRINNIRNLLVCVGFILTFFSSACLWNEEQLGNYIMCSMAVIAITVVTYLLNPIEPGKIINNRYIWWVVVIYFIFETYGLIFLRVGEFNWDYVLVSAILQICLTTMFIGYKTLYEVIRTFCFSCFVSVFIVSLYFIGTSDISLSNITFGSSFGLELSGNRNTLAVNIGIMLLPIAYLALKYKRWRFVLNIVVLAVMACMLLTGSKKGIIVVVKEGQHFLC